MEAKFGDLVSRRAAILEALATLDYNLLNSYLGDPIGNDRPIRELTGEMYEICDKLALVRSPSPGLRAVMALVSFAKAEFDAMDGKEVDVDLNRDAERLWEDVVRREPGNLPSRTLLMVDRLCLSDLLAARGARDEARRARQRAFAPARDKSEVDYQSALYFAGEARDVGRHPPPADPHRIEQLRARNTRLAIESLRVAIDDGFRDLGRLRDEHGFDLLRADPGFESVLAHLYDSVFPADPCLQP
jgi:hypothetical protein